MIDSNRIESGKQSHVENSMQPHAEVYSPAMHITGIQSSMIHRNDQIKCYQEMMNFNFQLVRNFKDTGHHSKIKSNHCSMWVPQW